MSESPPENQRSQRQSPFPETRWTLVLKAGDGDERAREALGELCQLYWFPLYSYARQWGLSPQDAEDGTQGFFQLLLANRSLDTVARDRGRLRSFLLASMRNFLTSRARHEKAQKRGGGQPLLSIDQDWAEGTLSLADPSDDREAAFDRHWAFAILNSVSARLEAHYDRSGKREIYEALKGCLEGDGSYESGSESATRLGLSPEGLRSAVFKLRRRFREHVEEAVRDTCADDTEVREEIAHLCRILAR